MPQFHQPPDSTVPLGCFIVDPWIAYGITAVFFKATTDVDTDRDCSTTEVCVCNYARVPSPPPPVPSPPPATLWKAGDSYSEGDVSDITTWNNDDKRCTNIAANVDEL